MTRALLRGAEAVAAALLAIIFVAFILQVLFRYVFNLPVGWTSELSVVAWLWLVLWGASFVLKPSEEIRFELLAASRHRRVRLAAGGIGALAIVVLFALSLPASYAYVSFMRVESSSYLKLRFDWMYSVYLVFAVAVILRQLWILWRVLRGRDPLSPDPTRTGSAL